MMEHRSAEVQQSIQHLAYDIDQRNVIDLMMIFEHSKCPESCYQMCCTEFILLHSRMSFIFTSSIYTRSQHVLDLQIVIELTSMSATDFFDSIAGYCVL
jgi:hypothetical protein